MKPFIKRILICVLPVLFSAVVVGMAWNQYRLGEGGFKPGVDLVGGTTLVYEVDRDKQLQGKSFDRDELAAALKRRIDPTDLYNIVIRPIGDSRVEIILPTGGKHQSDIEDARWYQLLRDIQKKWPQLEAGTLDIGRGSLVILADHIEQESKTLAWNKLIAEVQKKWPEQVKKIKLDALEAGKDIELKNQLKEAKVPDEELKTVFDKLVQEYRDAIVKAQDAQEFISRQFQASKKRRDITGERVAQIKELITKVGSLEFRILANVKDDNAAITAARAYIEAAADAKDPALQRERKDELDSLAVRGNPPPPPKPAEGSTFPWENEWGKGDTTYAWVELGRQERKGLDLDNAAKDDGKRSAFWFEVEQARNAGRTVVVQRLNNALLYSRPCKNIKLPDNERHAKQFEYFILTRDPQQKDQAITGKYLVSATAGNDRNLQPAVHFRFDTVGGNLFYDTTSKNRPTGPEGNRFYRHLAIILDDLIVSAPRLQEAIRSEGQISGNFTQKEVEQLVSILRAGALPATLKPLPVSENTIGPTLGQDTIDAGLKSVFWAFLIVMIFMVVYYRFSGVVACVALFANLLLTIAFMVMVNATFTLPGLAGLVLMLAMAVDANVLIYERLREERDRGASLALAIRNGYDRAFPTIIDTHLTSIFTAIVLYTVGNDQLKGFGISLTVGLLISLFTSLYMTRLMFDLWQHWGLLKNLNMFRILSNPSIDFMRIRYYWFTATIILTLFGITVFLIRGENGLNIDFTGGTLYGARLVEPLAMSGDPEHHDLRSYLSEENQRQQLKVDGVQQTDQGGYEFKVVYADGTSDNVRLTNPAAGATKEEREADVKLRAQHLPDWSVEQIFLSSESENNAGNKSRLFNVRTSEKAPDLVQVTVDRLFRKNGTSLLKRIDLKKFQVDTLKAKLEFSEEASPSQVKTLLEREAKAMNIPEEKVTFDVVGQGQAHDGRFKVMHLEVTDTRPAKADPADPKAGVRLSKEGLEALLVNTKDAFEKRPQPERLENFDKALAADTQGRALYAILASWGAILMYLWFRFGNWTFGLATVLCLMHDLFFTMGIIAFCHYVVAATPWLASLLLLEDFKIDLTCVAALLTLVGYSVSDTIVVFDRIREVRGKNPELTPQMINDSVNQTLSRTLLTAFSVFLVVFVLYIGGGEGMHLFAFVMVVGVVVGTYSSIYIASPLLLIFGEGRSTTTPEKEPEPEAAQA